MESLNDVALYLLSGFRTAIAVLGLGECFVEVTFMWPGRFHRMFEDSSLVFCTREEYLRLCLRDSFHDNAEKHAQLGELQNKYSSSTGKSGASSIRVVCCAMIYSSSDLGIKKMILFLCLGKVALDSAACGIERTSSYLRHES